MNFQKKAKNYLIVKFYLEGQDMEYKQMNMKKLKT